MGVCSHSSSLMDSRQTSELQNCSFVLNNNWLLKPLRWWKSAIIPVWKKRGTVNKPLVYLCLYDEFIGEPWHAHASFNFICYLVPPWPVCMPEEPEPEQGDESLRSKGAEIWKLCRTFLESRGTKLEVRKVAWGITRSHLIISRGKGDPD